MDEVDGWPPGGAGDEGDQVQLASKRTETFFNRKIIMGSTPTNKETSRVAKSFATSDQRFYYVPCPNPKCGHMQTLKFKNLTWDKDADGTHHPETAHFVCEKNGCIIEEKHKAKMLSLGEWRATKPSLGHAGFFIWTAYSLSANATWRQIAEEHIAAKEDILLRKTFTNTTLGETWEESGESVDSNSLIRRIENYDGATVPLPVTTLTFGTDVQDNRLETIVLGWGPKEECWVIDYKIFHGSPGEGPQVWGDLDHFLYGEYIREDGQKLRIRAGAIDTGGHFGSAVYDFCKKRIGRSIFPIKGIENGRVWPRVAKRNKNNELIYNVGTSQAKDILYAHLRMDKMGGPGFIHFPAGVCDEDFFKQLTSETCQTVWKAGRSSRKWILKKNQRNEVLDCMVYAFAAYKSLPHSDSMMQPPKPVYVDAVSGKPLAKNEPTSEVNLDNLFPQQIRKRRSISSMLPH
jgi:phage terminase large subunit GpA-like protein